MVRWSRTRVCGWTLRLLSGKEVPTGRLSWRENPRSSKLTRVLVPDADPHMPPKKQLAEDGKSPAAGMDRGGRDKAVRPTRDLSSRCADGADGRDRYFLAGGWQARQLTPAPICDDRTFIRRVTLDLVGRIPTPEETLAFSFDAAPDKRKTLVDRLLASDEAARNFREVWDLLLMGRRGARREERRREGGWHTFLENAFKQDRPWDDVVRTLITARPTQPEDAGAIWFLYERRNDHQQIAEAIAPVIYGTRIDCAQCHDHPLAGEIKQEHYWGLVAAFNRSQNTENGPPAVRESASRRVHELHELEKGVSAGRHGHADGQQDRGTATGRPTRTRLTAMWTRMPR